MVKDILGNEVTHDIWGKPLKKKIKRQPIGKSQKNLVKIKQKGKCKDCRKTLIIEEYHHIQYVSNNGKSTTGNLVALCPECHRKRHIKESALKLDKKRLKKDAGNNVSNNWINPLTGKKEKLSNLWNI